MKREIDYDLKEILNICGYKPEDVEEVLAQVPGAADGERWDYILKLKTGKYRYGYFRGWCDYTGWGCGDGADSQLASTPENAARKAKNESSYPTKKSIKNQLLDQLSGKQPYGLREQ